MTAQFRKATFTLDSLPNVAFEGFTDGSTWNGFACPYFTFDVAEDILQQSEVNGYRWDYDADQDVFLVWHEEDSADWEPEPISAVQISVGDSLYKSYPVGAYTWTWLVSQATMPEA